MAEVEVVVVLELGSSSISINECNSCIIIITIIIKLSFIMRLNKTNLARKMQIEGAASQLPCEELLDIQNLESQ